MTRFFKTVLPTVITVLACVSGCAWQEAPFEEELGDNVVTKEGWTLAAGTVKQVSSWHPFLKVFSLEGDATAAISKRVDHIPNRMKLIVDKDEGVSLSIVVEGFWEGCVDGQVIGSNPADESPTWTALPSDNRICSELAFNNRDDFCLVMQKRYPLQFSDDGIATAAIGQVDCFSGCNDLNMAISIVKKGAGTAILEKIYL